MDAAARWLWTAARYHEAAWRCQVFEPRFTKRLHATTLYLICLSLELTLKAQIIRNGAAPPKTHDIAALWADVNCAEVRHAAAKFHIDCHSWAKHSAKLRSHSIEVDAVPESFESFVTRLSEISHLYGRDSDFRLRYPDDTDPEAPIPLPFICVNGKIIYHLSTQWAVPIAGLNQIAEDPFGDGIP